MAVRRNQFSDCLHIVSSSSKSMKCEVIRGGACFLFSSRNDLKGLRRKLLIVPIFFIYLFIYLYNEVDHFPLSNLGFKQFE